MAPHGCCPRDIAPALCVRNFTPAQRLPCPTPAHAGRGVAYGLLGVSAYRAIGDRGSHGGGNAQQTRGWTARLLDLPYGRALVVAAGLGVIGYAEPGGRHRCQL